MRGAKDLLCDCGRFFATFHHEERLGKYIKRMNCSCGIEKTITTDKFNYKTVVKKDGIVVRETHGIHKKEARRRIWQRNQPHYIVSQTIPNT